MLVYENSILSIRKQVTKMHVTKKCLLFQARAFLML